MQGAEAAIDPVPEIDHADGDREVDAILFVEVLAQFGEGFVARAAVDEPCQLLGPAQDGALARGEEPDSSQALSRLMRISLSPALRASAMCMCRQ